MRLSFLGFFFLALLPIWSTESAALPPVVIDQLHEGPGGYFSSRFAAQVFTVGESGILDRIEVPLRPSKSPGQSGQLTTIRIGLIRLVEEIPRNWAGTTITSSRVNLPLPDALPFETNVASLSGFQWVSLSNIGLNVRAGDQYAIDIRASQIPIRGQAVDWCATFPDQLPRQYVGGEPWQIIDTSFTPVTTIQDFCFRTYVRPIPETPAFAAGMAGFLFVVASGRLSELRAKCRRGASTAEELQNPSVAECRGQLRNV